MTLTLVDNRYKVIRAIGKGGFGETFLVEDSQLPSGRHCVLKQLTPVEDNPQVYDLVKDRFQREAAILEDLGEANQQIPRLYAYFAENHKFYLVQEYIEGETLLQRVERQGVMSEAAVRQLLINTLPVLSYVHSRRIIHRDIKPDNIMLRSRDQAPVLIDFGAVRETMGTVMNEAGKSTQSIVIGTPGFMASEQAGGRPTFSSDLYSLGLTAIYLLTGKMPQELPSDPLTGEVCWRQFAPMVSPTLGEVLARAVMPGAQQRFQTAQEMLDVLVSGSVAQKTVMPSGSMPTMVSVPPVGAGQTVISAPPQVQPGYQQPVYTQQHTVVAAPGAAAVQPAPVAKQGMSEWGKAMIMGGLIGAFVLGGLFIMKPQQTTQASNSTNSQPAAPAGNTNVSVNTAPQAPVSSQPVSSQPVSSQPVSSQPVSSQPVSRQPVNQAPPVQTTQSAPSQPSISQGEAEQVIQSWLQAKRTLMAPPYDLSMAHATTTGPLLEDLTKSDGPVLWLRNNNAKYNFGVQKIEEINKFISNGDQATLEAWVAEDRTLYKNGVIDSAQTDFKSRLAKYTLEKVGGQWKVADYKNLATR